MSWVRSGWHEEEVNGSKAVVDCLSLLWLHDHDGLLSDICSAILSLGFHCTNRHQMFTFNKNVFVVELFLFCNNLIHTHHAVTLQDVVVVVVRSLLCTWLLHMFSCHLQSVGVLEFFLICNMCFISLSFAFKWFLLQPAPPPHFLFLPRYICVPYWKPSLFEVIYFPCKTSWSVPTANADATMITTNLLIQTLMRVFLKP